MKHATSIALYAHWQNRQRHEGVRARAIQADELASFLPSIFLLGMDRQADPTFRFCGVTIAARYGRDLCHEPFLGLWEGDDQILLNSELRKMREQSSGLVAGILAETFGGGFTSFEMLLLPLSAERGVAGVIGSMVRVGGHEETNRIRSRLISQSLRSVRFLPLPAKASPRRLRETPAAYVLGSSGERPRRYGHLTSLPGGAAPMNARNPAPLTKI